MTTPRITPKFWANFRCFSTARSLNEKHRCKLLVVGGGTGGCAVSAKFAKSSRNESIIVLEPSETHYYQPMFTLVGGGIKKLKDSAKPMSQVLPKNAKWLKDSAAKYDPKANKVYTKNGDVIEYDYLLVAVGLQLNYDKIPGLEEGLQMKSSGVCSNYSPKYVGRTYEALKEFESGNVIFTFPNSPVKCPGAPQKICYIAEHYLRKVNKRDKANIIYNTSLPVIFGVKKYANSLLEIVKQRNIKLNLRTNLIEVRPKDKVAVFENLDKPGEKTTYKYSLLHVTPPMGSPDTLKSCKEMVNEAGFVEVNKDTLQSTKFSNVFGIGDCSSSPNSKTAASVAAQSEIVFKNLSSVMDGKKPTEVYNGYASCPLVTGYDSCILAEFDYNLTPLETFPIDQSKESYIMYVMKKDMMPTLYWNMMLKGYWNGPDFMRRCFRLGMK